MSEPVHVGIESLQHDMTEKNKNRKKVKSKAKQTTEKIKINETNKTIKE